MKVLSTIIIRVFLVIHVMATHIEGVADRFAIVVNLSVAFFLPLPYYFAQILYTNFFNPNV